MYIDLEILKDTVLISYYAADGKVKFKKFKAEDIYEWELVDDIRDQNANREFKNYDGQPVKRIKTTKVNKFGLVEFLAKLPQSDQDDIFSMNMPNIYFLDIETELNDDSSKNIKQYIKEAINEVTAISLVSPDHVVDFFSVRVLDEKEQKDILLKTNKYVEKLTDKPYTINFHFYTTETEMLIDFFSNYVRFCPLITGWNVVDFDWTYLANRAINLGINIGLASPTRNYNKRNNNMPLHVAIMDYLEFYKKWDRKVKIKENFTLDSTASSVLGIKKIKYKGSLKDLFNDDFPKYAFYNIIDSILVQLIHYRLKTINIPLTLAAITKIPVYKTSSAVVITETLIFNELIKNNLVITKDNFTHSHTKRLYVLNEKSFTSFKSLLKKDKFKTSLFNKLHLMKDEIYKNEEDFLKRIDEVINNKNDFKLFKKIILDKSETKYQGAFVKDPITGKHFWVVSFDFASLYPTTMRQFNISMDSFIDKIHKTLINEARKNSSVMGRIICANGTMFKTKDSILKVIITELYNRRKVEKKLMFEYTMKVNEIKTLLERLETSEV